MNGPEHYAEAERLLAYEYRSDETARTGYAAAQVHATLALAAGVNAPAPCPDCALGACTVDHGGAV